MAWRQALNQFAKSQTVISMLGGMGATCIYVCYKDSVRDSKIMNKFDKGCVLAPLKENDFEFVYYSRKKEEAVLRKILSPEFSNEYYIVNGEVGVGKTRLIVEITRDLIQTKGKENKGAPIYVSVGQGKSFPDTLAAAVSFHFDEHIRFSFFFDFLMGIVSLPKKDDLSKLTRVLHAIERAAFKHLLKTSRPVVLVIDGVNNLEKKLPGALEYVGFYIHY